MEQRGGEMEHRTRAELPFTPHALSYALPIILYLLVLYIRYYSSIYRVVQPI